MSKICERRECDNPVPEIRGGDYCGNLCRQQVNADKYVAKRSARRAKPVKLCHCGNEIKPPRRVVCSDSCRHKRDQDVKASRAADPDAVWRGMRFEDSSVAVNSNDRNGAAPQPSSPFVPIVEPRS